MKKESTASPAGDDALTEPKYSQQALRKQAEARLAQSPVIPESITPEEIRQTLYELRVHQIELEMQNEELRTAQAEIEAGRSRYFELYDLAPVGYCTLSEKGLILETNLTAATLLGTTRSALVKQPTSRFILKDDQDVYYLHRKKLFEAHSPLRQGSPPADSTAPPAQECELRLVKPDGVLFWAHLTSTASHLEDGTPICRMALTDITERKRAETYRELGREILQILNEPDDLQESNQRVLAALKTRTGFDAVGLRLQEEEGEDFPYIAQDGFSDDFLLTENTLLERGKDGGVCRNKDGSACLECTCGLVISGKTDSSNPLFTKGGSCWTNDSLPLLNLPADQDPRLHPRNNCIHHGYASVALIPVRNKDRIVGLLQLNDTRKGRFTLETIEILEGIAAHIGAALMRKRVEEERLKLQVQLTQSQKMESVGRLAGGIAHDFNNMLTIILGQAQMLELDLTKKDEEALKRVVSIQGAGERAATLTRQILAFARKENIRPEVMDLNDAITQMLKMLQHLIREDIDLVWEPGRDLWKVQIDPSQLDQILTNLCINARDAIGGVGKITIETENLSITEAYCKKHVEARPGLFVCMTVSDDGCGMDQFILNKIFEPFFTTKAVGDGTGLGLATVHGIVYQNQGFINVYSEPGNGTTFRIYLPRTDTPSQAERNAAELEAVPCGDETILIVEDDTAVRDITRAFLQNLGYTVLECNGPKQALALVASHAAAIDMLITDVVMPEMNGHELAETLSTQRPEMKVLYISGYTADVIAHRGILEKEVNFLAKPFSREAIARRIREILDTGDMPREERHGGHE